MTQPQQASPLFDETAYDDTAHLIDCGICLSEMENPKALPCLHSFCRKCLKKLKHPPGKISCPLCKEECPLPSGGVDGLRDNIFIDQLKQRSSIRKIGHAKLTCVSCGAVSRASVSRCVECNGFLCQTCDGLHGIIAALKPHTVFTIKELKSGKVDISEMLKEGSCMKHKDQPLKFFCKTCGIPICQVCTTGKHVQPKHEYINLEFAVKVQMQEIEELMEHCKEVVKNVEGGIRQTERVTISLKSAMKKAGQDLQTAKDRALKQIEDNYQMIAEKLRRIEEERCAKIDVDKTQLTNLQAKLNNALEIAQQVVTSGFKHDVASNYTIVTQTLKQLGEAQISVTKDDASFVSFKQNKAAHMVHSLGKIKEHKCKWNLQKEIGQDGKGKLSNGVGVFIASNGDIAVADHANEQVVIYDSDGSVKLSLDTANGLENGRKSKPWGVVVNSDGKYYVTDCTAYVKSYSPKGNFLKTFPIMSPEGKSSDSERSTLRGLVIDQDGHLLVGNNRKNYISKHKQDGTHISSFAVDVSPSFIAVTPSGKIIVSPYSLGMCVHVLDSSGSLFCTIDAPKDVKSPAKTWHPTGVCCSDDGIIHVAMYGGCVNHFTEQGEYLGHVNTGVTHLHGLAYLSACDGHDEFALTQIGTAKIFCVN